MRRRYYKRLLWPVPLVLLQRCLDLFGDKRSEAPSDLLQNAVAGHITSDNLSSFVLVAEAIIFLLLFLIFYGDFLSEQLRTGAVYLFSRMSSRLRWFRRQTLLLGLFAFAYCGIYILGHTFASVFITSAACDAQLYKTALTLWLLFSLSAFLLALGGNFLCCRFGASVGIVGICLFLLLFAGLSLRGELPAWFQLLNPAAISDAVFTNSTAALKKAGVLCLECVILIWFTGWYFCKKDIFAVEGEG